jgi:hypothetical protein
LKSQKEIEKEFMEAPTYFIIGSVQTAAVSKGKLPDYKLDPDTYMVLKEIVETHKRMGIEVVTKIIVSFCRGYAEGRRFQDQFTEDLR